MEDVTDHSKMAAFVWLAIAVVLAMFLAISYYFTQQRKPKREATDAAKPRGQPVAAGDTAGGVRRRRGARMNRSAPANADAMWNDSEEELSDAEVLFEDKNGKKVGAKKQKKLEMKAERREARENEVEEREERKKKEAQLIAEKAKEEEERRRREVDQADEERLRKEEQERIEHEAYLKMKEEFSIDESGEVGVLSEDESQSLLRKFVDHVKQEKVVLLEDLATEFNLKVQETITRLEELQEMGELTGVMDDRGKFIYISREELEAVARFIRQRGRVSISDLAESSNELIKMQRVCEPAVDKLVEG